MARAGPLIYITGGTGPEGDPRREVLRFSTVSQQWDQVCSADPMQTPRYGHEAICALGRYILCIGGNAAGVRESPQGSDEIIGGSTDVLDAVTGRWARLPCHLEHARVYFGAAVVGRFVVVAGGKALGAASSLAATGPADGRLGTTEFLDTTALPGIFDDRGDSVTTSSLHWRQGPALHYPRFDFSLAGPLERHLYAVGGSGASRIVEVLDVSELLDEAPEPALTAGWQVHDVALPESRSTANAVAVGRQLVLIGGSDRTLLSFGHGATSWRKLGVELATMRLGAKAVAFGQGSY